MLLLLLLIVSVLATAFGSMPPPFSRELKVVQPALTGSDVTIAQTLLKRDSAVDQSLAIDGVYADTSAAATSAFQKAHALTSSGVLDEATATKLLDLHSADGYKDSGFTAASMGYLYKFHIPVHSNRSVETVATLFDKDNNELLKFRARTHGARDDGSSTPRPDFGDGGVGLSQFASNGNTVTGLVEMDFNTPEPDPQVYGPWPINRIVRGLDGNALTLLPNIRDGLLVHTGNYSSDSAAWRPTMPMPNSAGCVHAHPSDVKAISDILTKLGVVANPNTFSGKNYPYKAQGVGVIELID